jgi:hypothetical protein
MVSERDDRQDKTDEAQSDKGQSDAYDSPWKGALEHFFEAFLALLFPEIHGRIDWRVRPDFLDQELPKVVRAAKVAAGTVDKLVRVQTLDKPKALLEAARFRSAVGRAGRQRQPVCADGDGAPQDAGHAPSADRASALEAVADSPAAGAGLRRRCYDAAA